MVAPAQAAPVDVTNRAEVPATQYARAPVQLDVLFAVASRHGQQGEPRWGSTGARAINLSWPTPGWGSGGTAVTCCWLIPQPVSVRCDVRYPGSGVRVGTLFGTALPASCQWMRRSSAVGFREVSAIEIREVLRPWSRTWLIWGVRLSSGRAEALRLGSERSRVVVVSG